MSIFTNFINEAVETQQINNTAAFAKNYINLLNKTAKTTYVYVDDMKFTNAFGKMTGSLFVSGTKGLRINFKGNKPFSMSKWDKFGYNIKPTKEIVFLNKTKTDHKGMIGILPMVIEFEQHKGLPEYQRTFIYLPGCDHFIYNVDEAVVRLYLEHNMTNLEDIQVYLYKQDSQVDWDYIKDVYEETVEYLAEKEKETVIPSQVTAAAKAKLEDEYPEEYEEVEYTGDVSMDTSEVEASEETIEEEKTVKQSEDELAAQLIADPLPVFEKLNSYVVMIARGISQALLITGQGGVGKSYNVNRILNAFGTKNKDYVIMKGKSTVSAMYKFLYDNYNKICVFDDCDSILEDSDGMNILKGALDSGNIREISWNSKGSDMVDTFGCETHEEIEEKLDAWSAAHKGKVGTPNYFQFQGACIFISNKTVEEIEKKDAALLTRCTNVDINLLAKDVILRMKSVLPTVKIYKTNGQDITDEAVKQEVFDYISSDTFLKDPRMKGKQISFRLLNNVYKLKIAGLPAWQELAFGCC